MTNTEIQQRGRLISSETATGGNTAARVGGVIEAIGQNLEENVDAIAAEATARASADDTLQDNIDAEASLRQQGDTALETTLQANIDAEASLRQQADTALQDNIDAETTSRQTNDATIQAAIEAESTARSERDTTLQTNIDNEKAAREHADSTLSGLITAEASARETADATLQANISAEVSARQAADTTLQDNIDAEESAREAADTNLSASIAPAWESGRAYTTGEVCMYGNVKYICTTAHTSGTTFSSSYWSVVTEPDDEPTAGSDNLVKSGGVKLSVTPNYFVHTSKALTNTGVVVTSSSADICITDYLPINGSEDITVRGWCTIGLIESGNISPIHFYDSERNFLSAWTDNYRGDNTYTIAKASIPSGARYVRFTGNVARTPWYDAALVLGGIDLAGAVQEIGNMKDEFSAYPSDWSGEFFTVDGYLIRTDGSVEAHEGFAITPYIPITGESDITVKGVWQFGTISPLAFFDEDKRFISSASSSSQHNVSITVSASDIPSAARYIRCTCNTAQNVEHTIIGTDMAALLKYMDENDSGLQADIDNVESLLVKKVPQTPTVISGSWFGTDGTVGTLASISIYKYTIEEGEEYILDAYQPSGYGVPILGFMDENEQIFDALKKFGESGSSETTVSDYTISIPDNAVYIVVNVINAQASRTSVGEKQHISVSELEQKVESVSISRMSKVTVSAGSVRVRTQFDSTRDIITTYALTENGNFTWDSSYLGGKDDTDAAVMQNLVHVMGDSTAPVCNGSKAPWHMWTQHGYCIPVITTSSSLSSDDIGSVWMDASGRKYTIGNISGTTVYLLPEIKDSSVSGVKTRSWEVPADNPVTTPLTWVSGGVTTSDITVESSSYTQIRPFMELVRREFIADGKRVTEYGTYECDEFVISETMRCLDPWTTIFFPSVVAGDTGAYLTETFTITGMSCRYDTVLNMQKPYFFGWYGINQVQHLAVRSEFQDYDKVCALMPRVKKEYNGSPLSVPFDATDLTRTGEVVVRSTSNLYDEDKQPDRFLTWLEDSGTNEMLIGVASGYSLTRGLTKDTERNNLIRVYQSGDRECVSINPSLRNKCYLKCVVDNHYADGVLPSSFIGQFSTYMSYFDPNANTGQVYWYKDGNDYIIYAHYQEAHDKEAINLPFVMEGRTVEVVDSTDDMELITDTVNDGKLFVSVPSSDHSYIVLKTK